MTSASLVQRAFVRRPLILVLAGIGYSGAVVALAFVVPVVARAGISAPYLTDVAIGVSFTTIGILVTLRRPGNAMGWLFLGIGVLEGVVAACNHYAVVGLTNDPPFPAARWAAWLGYWLVSLIAPSGLFLLLLLLFPSGRPISKRWAWVAWAGIAFSMLFVLVEMFLLERMEVTPELTIDNPTNVGSSQLPENVWMVGMVILLIGVVGVIVRFRRSRGEERQQLRWFMFAVAAGIGLLAFLVVVYSAIGSPEPEPAWFLLGTVLVPLVGIGIGVPAACGIAILRYRLWDLDVVIRKTVVVAVVTVAITLVYVAIVGGIGAIVGSRLDTALGFVAAAVLAVAFQPIREGARRVADRIVYGNRATPYEVLADFSDRVADTYAADDVLPQMAQVLGEGTGATATTVWIDVSGELRPAASWPVERRLASVPLVADRLPSLGEDAFEVRHRGELLGALSLSMPANDPLDATKERLARDLASQAGLVLRNVRLIEELRASRQRLVSAQDEERRKLERNLHDGAQQQLVALQVQIRLAKSQVGKDPESALEILHGVQQAAGAALEELRDLARGIYPPLLADQGLVAALRAQSQRAPVPVSVEGDGIGRYDREIEAAVYFCTLEALNNVAKYAEPTSVAVELRDDGALRFRVRDDGRGFDARNAPEGTGVQGMRDRLEAIGGHLTVSSEPGRGTTVEGVVPT